MNSKVLFALGLVLLVGIVNAKVDEYNDDYDYSQSDESEKSEKKEATSDEEKKPSLPMEMEDPETSMALAPKADYQDPDTQKNKGSCHWGQAVWYKPGIAIRCNCMRCTCQNGGNWACGYWFPYCPYFYCGNVLYNPANQLCCCGKVHTKQRNYACCGYFYYDTRTAQCCNYYSVKPKKAKCPRHKI